MSPRSKWHKEITPLSEFLTPGSSCFWPLQTWAGPGSGQWRLTEPRCSEGSAWLSLSVSSARAAQGPPPCGLGCHPARLPVPSARSSGQGASPRPPCRIVGGALCPHVLGEHGLSEAAREPRLWPKGPGRVPRSPLLARHWWPRGGLVARLQGCGQGSRDRSGVVL